MELYPIYEESTAISPNIWYSVSGLGESPFMRVGHSMVHFKQGEQSSKGKLYIIGGANPSGSFNEVYTFDMDTLSWDKWDINEENGPFSTGRYEHACALVEPSSQILIFGGSSETQSYNDVLSFDLNDKKISTNSQKSGQTSTTPTTRTIHQSNVLYKNQLVVYGGGSAGKTPVQDNNAYIYNSTQDKWICIDLTKTNKQIPKARQGHFMASVIEKDLIYMHGGMNDEEIFDDLWILNLKALQWQQVDMSASTSLPKARAAHGGISHEGSIYIFGGIDGEGQALDDLWKFDTAQNQWSFIEIFGYKPPGRLDFAYCKMSFIKSNESNSEEGGSEEQSTVVLTDQAAKLYNFLVIHGGMDTEGNVFDDLFIINLE